MEGIEKQRRDNGEGDGQRHYAWWIVGIGCLVVVLVGIFIPRGDRNERSNSATNPFAGNALGPAGSSSGERLRTGHAHAGSTASAEEIVAEKLTQFARSRRPPP